MRSLYIPSYPQQELCNIAETSLCRKVAMEKVMAAQTASYSCGVHSGGFWVCMDLVGLWERSWQPVRMAGEVWLQLLQPLGKHREGLPDPGSVARLRLYLSTVFTAVRLVWCVYVCLSRERGRLLSDSEDLLSSPKCRSEAGPETVW